MICFHPSPRSALLTAIVLAFACDGGCSGCQACGLEPIPGGYPLEERVENAAQIRLSDRGVAFVEENFGAILSTLLPGGLRFDVDAISTSVDTGFLGDTDIDICRANDCAIQAELADATIDLVAPSTIRASLPLVIDARTRTGERRALPVRVDPPILGSTNCSVDIDTRRGSRPHVTVEAEIALVEETRGARAGFTVVDVRAVGLSPDEGLEGADVTDPDCSGISGFIIELIAGLVKDNLVDGFVSSVQTALQDALDEQLCTRQGSFGCPMGTVAATPDPGAACVFEGTQECAPILLGADGQGDLGAALLSSLSPGVHGPVQFLLAAGGPGEVVAEGLSVFAYGGLRSTDLTFSESPGHNPCVPIIEPPAPPSISRSNVFRGNQIPGTAETAHVGLGLSESFLNYASYGLFDSGMLCLGVGTRLSQQLSTGLVSAVIPGLAELAFPLNAAPLSLVLRPQEPPAIRIGDTGAGEPLLSVTFSRLAMDFYVWSTERYIRFLTFTADLAVEIDLRVDSGGLVPVIRRVVASDSVITNDELVRAPEDLGSTIETLISVFAGSLVGSVGPIELPAIMGFELLVGSNGVQGFSDAGERFLGVFADLSIPEALVVTTVDTKARVEELHVDPRALEVESWGEGGTPWARLRVDGAGPPGDLEMSYRIDGLPWTDWQPSRPQLTVQGEALLFQGRHVVEVRQRLADTPSSVDPSPARVELIVDALAPAVAVERTAQGVRVSAEDVVTPSEDLNYRVRVESQRWGEWHPLSPSGETRLALPYEEDTVVVEVRDEAGNVGVARSALVRGLPNPNAQGCDCATVDNGARQLGTAAITLAFLAGVMTRRNRRRRRRSR